MSRDTYHHGDLKAVILAKAATLVAERGADGISLRELAREAGVSHAAPAHHFTDRRGLFTALAAEGWRLLADALAAARPDFIDAALAYVRFALDHPGHYAVMFDRSLVNADDPELVDGAERGGRRTGARRRHAERPTAPRRIHKVPRSRRGRWCTGLRCSGSTRRSTPTTTRWRPSRGSR